ncbi:ATP-grasp domain-containing protein [Treponema sp. HNW]|uniref:ATP-grasp domain-containing protein n=1 Tax=Treponema sp. HNW TaxID=3116654 RepID=UPI003D0EC521
MKKHVLILGASLMQKPAVEAARDLGCRITLVDGNPNALSRSYADSFEQIDLKDTEKIVDFALCLRQHEGLHGVFTAGTDFSYAVARAAEACALPGHNSEAALRASDKVLMRSCFEKAGVPSPRFVEADGRTVSLDKKGLLSWLKKNALDFPLVVKPCDNMGARGCRLVHSADEFSSALSDAVRYSKTARAVVEEYMDGPEFSIDAIVCQGELTVTGFADRHIFFPPYFVEMGHTIPSNLASGPRFQLFKTFAEGVRALGLSCGAAKADIKLTSRGPMVGEIAARLSGGYMSGWTFPYASDLNLTREALSIALGEPPEALSARRVKTGIADSPFEIFEVPCVRHCAERAWISIPGKIKETLFFEKAEKRNGVCDFFPRAHVNDTVDFPQNNVEKAGNVLACAPGYEKASDCAAAAVKTVFLRLEERNITSGHFLFQALDTAYPPSAFQLPPDVLRKLETLEYSQKSPVCLTEKMHIRLPPVLEDCADLTDWNGRSLRETVDLYNELYKKQSALPKSGEVLYSSSFSDREFWHCLIRGGLQGAVFYFDSRRSECL